MAVSKIDLSDSGLERLFSKLDFGENNIHEDARFDTKAFKIIVKWETDNEPLVTSIRKLDEVWRGIVDTEATLQHIALRIPFGVEAMFSGKDIDKISEHRFNLALQVENLEDPITVDFRLGTSTHHGKWAVVYVDRIGS